MVEGQVVSCSPLSKTIWGGINISLKKSLFVTWVDSGLPKIFDYITSQLHTKYMIQDSFREYNPSLSLLEVPLDGSFPRGPFVMLESTMV